MNFDLMFEKYFKTIGIVSAGVFYKDIKDFIVTETREDYLLKVQPGILTVSPSMEEMPLFSVLKQQPSVSSIFCPVFGKVLDCMPTTPIQPAV
jgi:hypothetical protein